MRLRDDSVLHLGFSREAATPVPADINKLHVRSKSLPPGTDSVRLVRIYKLLPKSDGQSGIDISSVAWNDAFHDLMDCTYRIGEPDLKQLGDAFRRLTSLAALGLLRRLAYLHDFAQLDDVREAVLADVGEVSE
jgi:hypothetical protein